MDARTTSTHTTPVRHDFAIKIWSACWDGSSIWFDFATAEEARIALRSEIYSFFRATSEHAPAKRTIDLITRGKEAMITIRLDRTNRTYTIGEGTNYGWF